MTTKEEREQLKQHYREQLDQVYQGIVADTEARLTRMGLNPNSPQWTTEMFTIQIKRDQVLKHINNIDDVANAREAGSWLNRLKE